MSETSQPSVSDGKKTTIEVIQEKTANILSRLSIFKREVQQHDTNTIVNATPLQIPPTPERQPSVVLERNANEFTQIGVSNGINVYLQEYGFNQVNKLLELAKQNVSIFNRVVELGIPPEFAEKVLLFERARGLPKKDGYSFSTHALRLEHYLKMLEVSEKKDPHTGFQLRSKAENHSADIDAEAYSMGGTYDSSGLPYISFQKNSIANGYGDLAWVGPDDVLFRNPDAGISYKDRTGTGELNVYTRKGKLINILLTIEKFQGNAEEASLLSEAMSIYKELKGEPFLPENVEEVKQMVRKDIDNEALHGVDLLNPFIFCLVPEEEARVIREKIAAAHISDSIKYFLQSQILVYAGDGRNIYTAYNNLVSDAQVYAARAAASSQFTKQPLSTPQALELINVRDTLAQSTVVRDKYKYKSLSDVPLPKQDSNGINSYLEMALRDRLQSLPEWNFLKQLPKEADSLLMSVFDRLIEYGTDGVMSIDSITDRNEILEKFKDLAPCFTQRLHELDGKKRELAISIFGLNDVGLDVNKSVFDLWCSKVLPYYRR